MFTCVWEIQIVKHIRSDKDNKSNHGRQYTIELELYVLGVYPKDSQCPTLVMNDKAYEYISMDNIQFV